MKLFDREYFGLKHTSRLTIERLRCQFCGKAMPLRTQPTWDPGCVARGPLFPSLPKDGALAWSSVRNDLVSVWYGEYGGYGWIDGDPLFCKQPCAIAFAKAAFKAGYRRKPNQ